MISPRCPRCRTEIEIERPWDYIGTDKDVVCPSCHTLLNLAVDEDGDNLHFYFEVDE